jgi:outer membrane protein TolC
MLKNSPEVQLTRMDVYTAANQVTASNTPFDPLLQASFNAQRSITPLFFGGGFSSGGAGGGGGTGTGIGGTGGTGAGAAVILPQTISSLTQRTGLTFSESLPTGQTFSTAFTGTRSSGDFYTYPAVFGSLEFNLTQPLLQNRTNLQMRGPLMAAREMLVVTSQESEASIGEALATAASAYWQAVQARDTIRVREGTLDLAQKSYERDKMALDLGALASLDIYQSQTQVAERKRDLIQAQYNYRIALDGLRHFIGADLTPELRALDLVLDDDASATPARSEVLPFDQALAKAQETRPEFHAVEGRLHVDELNRRIARDALLPRLDVNLIGGSSGPSFNEGGIIGGGVPAVPYPGYGQTLGQVLGFNFPSYGLGVQMNLPFRNSAAKAQLSDALVSRVKDRYQKRALEQTIALQVRQAIDNIEFADASVTAAKTTPRFSAQECRRGAAEISTRLYHCLRTARLPESSCQCRKRSAAVLRDVPGSLHCVSACHLDTSRRHGHHRRSPSAAALRIRISVAKVYSNITFDHTRRRLTT